MSKKKILGGFFFAKHDEPEQKDETMNVLKKTKGDIY